MTLRKSERLDSLGKRAAKSSRSFAIRVLRKMRREYVKIVRRIICLAKCTFSDTCSGRSLLSHLGVIDLPSQSPPNMSLLVTLADSYREHRFDLLGSGWRHVRHGRQWPGHLNSRDEMLKLSCMQDGMPWIERYINRSNRSEALRIWTQIDIDYIPIDWQVDFKSGFRWRESNWHGDCNIGYLPNRDVKVPWELGRCQHLISLAQAFTFTKDNVYAEEFRNQVLDFIATNPPGFGVQWRCPMDVAIRVANWILAYDLFRIFGYSFDSSFNDYLINSVYAHGRHIVENLEWTPETRGNHFLADVVGLAFVAAYLPRTSETDAWLAFSVSQLIVETERQFGTDGGNFEGSTSYHRLSAELVLFATALILGLSPEKRRAFSDYDHRLMPHGPGLPSAPLPLYQREGDGAECPFPASHFHRLDRIVAFTVAVTKPSGQIHQVGDNDCGRLFKLDGVYDRLDVAEVRSRFSSLANYYELDDDTDYWLENALDHRELLNAWKGFLPRESTEPIESWSWATAIIRSLLNGGGALKVAHEPTSVSTCDPQHTEERAWQHYRGVLWEDSSLRAYHGQVDFGEADWFHELEFIAFEDFGLYIWRSTRIYLAIRCGRLADGNGGGHAHCDQLAIELQVDGLDLLVDPGTYVYTADLRLRNLYRSVSVHHAPHAVDGREPGDLSGNPFVMRDVAQGECLYAGPRGFIGRHRGFGQWTYRSVEFAGSELRITDFAAHALRLQPPPSFSIDRPLKALIPFSPGYGWVERIT